MDHTYIVHHKDCQFCMSGYEKELLCFAKMKSELQKEKRRQQWSNMRRRVFFWLG
ncbi:hypothetical protein [Parasulfitobacter algicola]|uniref:Uncharacterized protein n=1 Tax=Parasulfitobacter algicola TaxID=2614809 RepID=A0ABX2IPF0_9RHOB|nr:hypothetical protein [Sulfitobacter algicola]NSX54767.1 hypothetical protein [Sulfitobacter algicola]